tara:strand:- start:94 stop:504 length:411 start_codon:yes stop_codon:yes gene_type:complete
MKIYSKIKPEVLLHFVNRLSEITDERHNLVSDDNFIQCAAMKLPKGKTFKPHKHFKRERLEKAYIPQESWLVIKGSVKCTFYDLDDKVISEPILHAGDASFTLHGAHTYTILEEGTLVYEYKTGPYQGIDLDKKFI